MLHKLWSHAFEDLWKILSTVDGIHLGRSKEFNPTFTCLHFQARILSFLALALPFLLQGLPSSLLSSRGNLILASCESWYFCKMESGKREGNCWNFKYDSFLPSVGPNSSLLWRVQVLGKEVRKLKRMSPKDKKKGEEALGRICYDFMISWG